METRNTKIIVTERILEYAKALSTVAKFESKIRRLSTEEKSKEVGHSDLLDLFLKEFEKEHRCPSCNTLLERFIILKE